MRRLGLTIFLLALGLLVPANARAQNRVTASGHVYFQDQSHPAANVRATLSNSKHLNSPRRPRPDPGDFDFRR